MKCENCGKEFERDKYHKNQKNCNTKCYMQLYRKIHREEARSYRKKYYLKIKNAK